MIANHKELLREHAARWERIGPELEAQRRSELRELDSIEAIMQLLPAFDLAAKLPPRPSSGLVEQQAIFKRLHHKK